MWRRWHRELRSCSDSSRVIPSMLWSGREAMHSQQYKRVIKINLLLVARLIASKLA